MQRRRFLQVAAAVVGLVATPGIPSVAAPAAPVAAVVKSTGQDLFVPELWAAESLKILEENLAISKLVHRDFEAPINETVSQLA